MRTVEFNGAELVADSLDGNRGAFRRIVGRYQTLVSSLAAAGLCPRCLMAMTLATATDLTDDTPDAAPKPLLVPLVSARWR